MYIKERYYIKRWLHMKLIVKTDLTFYTIDEIKTVTFVNGYLVIIFNDGSTSSYSSESLDNGTITIVN